MTNLQALQSLIDYDNTNLLTKVLLDNDIDAAGTYSKVYSNNIELCSAYVIQAIISTPDFSEGALSLNYDRASMIKVMNSIFEKNGIGNQKIENSSDLW